LQPNLFAFMRFTTCLKMKFRLDCRDIAVACSGLSVEYAWAIGEAVMIPHLLASPVSLSPALAGTIWLVNPIFGFCIGPVLGKKTDQTGRRKWVTILALLAILSHVILIMSPSVKMSRAAEITISFVAFGLMDLCHDLILIPGRALLVDQFSTRGVDVWGEDDGGVADTMYTTMQAIGRLGASFVGIFPIEHLFPFHVSYYQAMLTTSAAVLLIANSLAVTFGKEKYLGIVNKKITFCDNQSVLEPLLGTVAGDRKASSNPSNCWGGKVCLLVMVLIVQFIGWVSLLAFSFWCTTWLGLQTTLAGSSLSFPMYLLTLQTLLSLMFSFLLPKLNQSFSIARVWFLFELITQGSLCICHWLGPENPIPTFIFLVLGFGPFFVTHQTNAHLVSRLVIGEEDGIGWVAGLLNNTMNLAQILVGGLFGVFVECNEPADGSTFPCPQIGQMLFPWIGLVGLVIDLLILTLDISCFEGRIFSSKPEKKYGIAPDVSLLRSRDVVFY